MTPIRFFVPGTPRPGGSKRPLPNKRTGKTILVDDCSRNKEWRAVVALVGSENFRTGPLDKPLSVRFDFQVIRPKGHFKKNGTLRASAPLWPTVKPDCTKLIRSTEDALTGIAWRDDSLIVQQMATKWYEDRPGCWITITPQEMTADARREA